MKRNTKSTVQVTHRYTDKWKWKWQCMCWGGCKGRSVSTITIDQEREELEKRKGCGIDPGSALGLAQEVFWDWPRRCSCWHWIHKLKWLLSVLVMFNKISYILVLGLHGLKRYGGTWPVWASFPPLFAIQNGWSGKAGVGKERRRGKEPCEVLVHSPVQLLIAFTYSVLSIRTQERKPREYWGFTQVMLRCFRLSG